MSTLARFAGPLALLGGMVWVIATLIAIADPLSYAWIGWIASMLLIGVAALGLQRQLGARTGRLGRWGAAATAGGSVAIVTLVLFTFATGQATASTPPPPVLTVVALLAFLLFIVGSIVFALGLMRAKAISPIAGWLIVLGGPVGFVLSFAGGQNPSPFFYLPLALYGVGWVLVGFAARTRAADLGVAGQPS